MFPSAHDTLMLQSNQISFRFQGRGSANVITSLQECARSLFVAVQTERLSIYRHHQRHLSVKAGWNSQKTLMKASRLFKSLLATVDHPPTPVAFSVDLRCKDMSRCTAQSTLNDLRWHLNLVHHNSTKPLISLTAQRHASLKGQKQRSFYHSCDTSVFFEGQIPRKKWRGGGCIVTLEEIETFIKPTNSIVLEQHKRQREILIYMQGGDLY